MESEKEYCQALCVSRFNAMIGKYIAPGIFTADLRSWFKYNLSKRLNLKMHT